MTNNMVIEDNLETGEFSIIITFDKTKSELFMQFAVLAVIFVMIILAVVCKMAYDSMKIRLY